jgi:3',5'-cyclic AMP phosphodiesterase CpdA
MSDLQSRGEQLVRKFLRRDIQYWAFAMVLTACGLAVFGLTNGGRSPTQLFACWLLTFLLTPLIHYWWLWSLFLFRTRRLKEYEVPVAPEMQTSRILRVAHLSDLHLTASCTMEHGLASDIVAANAYQALQWATARADLVLITGDITDSGRAKEWAQFREMCEQLGLAANKIAYVPGNHDLSILDESDNEFLYQESVGASSEYDERCREFCYQALRFTPTNWYTLYKAKKVYIRNIFIGLDPYFHQHFITPPRLGPPEKFSGTPAGLEVLNVSPQLRKLAYDYEMKGALFPTSDRVQFTDAIRLLYPMVIFENEAFFVVAINSSLSASTSFLRGALGRVGIGQRRRLKMLLRSAKGRVVLMLVHHHLGFPTAVRRRMIELSDLSQANSRRLGAKILHFVLVRLQLRLLSLTDARSVSRIISRIHKTIIFHGHKHVRYRAKYRNSVIISEASVTFGDTTATISGNTPNASIYSLSGDGAVALLEQESFLISRSVR